MRGAAAPPGRMRLAAPRDLDRVVELWYELVAHHAPLHPAFRVRSGGREQVRAMLREGLAGRDAGIWVWESGTDLAGFCIARVRGGPTLASEPARGEIEDLGVRADARRRGIGRALAEVAMAWLRERGLTRVEVRVASGNHEGQAFWRALGFADFVDVLDLRL